MTQPNIVPQPQSLSAEQTAALAQADMALLEATYQKQKLQVQIRIDAAKAKVEPKTT